MKNEQQAAATVTTDKEKEVTNRMLLEKLLSMEERLAAIEKKLLKPLIG